MDFLLTLLNIFNEVDSYSLDILHEVQGGGHVIACLIKFHIHSAHIFTVNSNTNQKLVNKAVNKKSNMTI